MRGQSRRAETAAFGDKVRLTPAVSRIGHQGFVAALQGGSGQHLALVYWEQPGIGDFEISANVAARLGQRVGGGASWVPLEHLHLVGGQ